MVLVGGVDVRDADPVALRRDVSIVFQESFLFATTVRENIALDPGARRRTSSARARSRRPTGSSESLPHGYDTVVGERGHTLSGGERQRVALARALARGPRVLILDDATSSVDPTIEAEILGALRRELSSTLIVVAYRLSTIRLADRVIFLEDGRVGGTGSHDELLATHPGYAAIIQPTNGASDDRPDRSTDDDIEIPPELEERVGGAPPWPAGEPRAARGARGSRSSSRSGVTVATLVTPVLVQQVFDHGFDGGFRPRFVFTVCAVAFGLVVLAFVAARAAGRRLVAGGRARAQEPPRADVRHIHDLSIAEQSEEKRGVFVARVTADVDALQEFMEWGGIAWIISFAQLIGALVLMLVYSWQLSLAIVVLADPVLLIVASSMQARLTAAYNTARTRVGEMLSEVSESVMGAAVVRAYGIEDADRPAGQARDRRALPRRGGGALPRGDALAAVDGVLRGGALGRGRASGPGSAPTGGSRSAGSPRSCSWPTCSCTCSPTCRRCTAETQTAIAGWRKILAVLDLPVEVVEPEPGRRAARGALSVEAQGRAVPLPGGRPGAARDRRRGGGRAAHRDRGRDRVRQDHVREAAHAARRPARGARSSSAAWICATSRPSPAARPSAWCRRTGSCSTRRVRENVRAGREGATDRDVETALEELGLGGWVAALPHRLDTPVGERGEALSVGERQLVALARAQIADAGRADPGRGHAAPSTPPPNGGSRRRSGVCRRDAPSSRSRTGCPPPSMRTTCSCSTPDEIVQTGHARGAGGRGRRLRTAVRELARERPDGRRSRARVSGVVDGLRAVAAAGLFPSDGELKVAGLDAPVEVRRDRWGAVYIRAASLDDLWFAQGLVTAGERLFQLDLALRQANGRLSEVFADRTLAADSFARTIGLHRAGDDGSRPAGPSARSP